MDREPNQLGNEMHRLVAELYPIGRSITGDGVRQTLAKLRERVPLDVREVPSGTRVFDWTVPDEWNVREAYVANARGERAIDFRQHNLHLVGYSTPVRARMSLAELRPHLHSLPDRPDWIPYRTSYYKPSWGFCLAHRQLEALPDGEYEVVIDATLAPGGLTYGELLLPGQSKEEILFSAHVCHPSLANDNLSGIAVLSFLAAELGRRPRKHSFRFVFAPGTIGAITWLAQNEESARRIRHGLVVAGVGDAGGFTYKRSRRGDAVIDRAMTAVLAASGQPHRVIDFTPYGYDERQYCSPGFDLPVGLFMRSLHGTFPEYHTSADDLSFVKAEKLEESYRTILSVVEVLERNSTFVNTNPKCEPQLGRRGLYEGLAGRASPREFEMAMLWVLNLSDGGYDLLRIAERSGLAFGVVADAADALLKNGLLRETGVHAWKT
jgi:aminopeptidase-like protein